MYFFRDYIYLLIQSVPHTIYLLLLAILCILSILLISFKGFQKGFRNVMAVLLIEYIVFLYCSTVIYRAVNVGDTHNFVPFWSYVKIINGTDLGLLPQNVMNVVVFLPVGVLGGGLFHKNAIWKVVGIAAAISLSIEIMQFVLQRGFSEFDDVFHNTLGALIGYVLWQGAKVIVISFRDRNKPVISF